ncbi:hypothetical protein [Bacillus mycoides]|nr:hypothetical protein [Bacillus mycoides]MDM5430273.1 hypothetical protein [Bacillus mycoides]
MHSLFVGLIAVIIFMSAAWVVAGKLGIFDFIGNKVMKLKNIFKEEK